MRPAPARPKRDWEALARRAVHNRDLLGARAAFGEALKTSPRSSRLHRDCAAVLQELGEIDEAARHLCQALRLEPAAEDAARRLARLATRFVVEAPGRLDRFGLKAALGFETADRQPLSELALRHLAANEPDLAAAIAAAREGNASGAARNLLHRSAGVLGDALLLAALETGVIADPDLERLFTALRQSLLLEAEPSRWADRRLYSFALALVLQCWNNGHAWAEAEEETGALERLGIDRAALRAGDLESGRRLLLACLYRRPETILGTDEPAAWSAIRPKPLRERITRRLEQAAARRRAQAALPRSGAPRDDISRRVAGQYERSPYPQWQSVQLTAPGSLRRALERYFAPARLAFMERPFEVLVAGAGTGLQALQSAFGYGPGARLLAVDLSAASLAYADTAARHFGAGNIEFLVADILDLGQLDRTFDVIECVGVLHHMADPWSGWRMLLDRLAPAGIMYVGLYSAVSRENIRRLRAEPGYPGPACDDRAARAYRADLLARRDGQPGAELRRSRNFYTLEEFRDLVLHENEHHLKLEDIAAFLEGSGLRFRGFTIEPAVFDHFAAHYPHSVWPGKLDDWARYERDHPRTFDAMYRFWCERLDTEQPP